MQIFIVNHSNDASDSDFLAVFYLFFQKQIDIENTLKQPMVLKGHLHGAICKRLMKFPYQVSILGQC